MDEVKFEILKEFKYNDGENKYYASLSSRDGEFEVVTQVNTDKPFYTTRTYYSDAVSVFKDFVLTSGIANGLLA